MYEAYGIYRFSIIVKKWVPDNLKPQIGFFPDFLTRAKTHASYYMPAKHDGGVGPRAQAVDQAVSLRLKFGHASLPRPTAIILSTCLGSG